MAGSSSGGAPHLPGFYYDPEKNRYFRVRPGNNNHNPLTEEIIKKKMKMKEAPECETPDKKTHKHIKQRCNITKLLQQRSIGLNSKNSLKKFKFDTIKSRLKVGDARTVDCSPTHWPTDSTSEALVAGFLPNSEYSEIMSLTASVSPVSHSYTTTLNFNFCKRGSRCPINELPKVQSICYASFDSTSQPGILLTSLETSMVGYFCHQSFRTYIKGAPTPFACAAAKTTAQKYKVSYSDGKKCILVSHLCHFQSGETEPHPRGGTGYTVRMLPSDVLAQSFSYSPNIHFNGIRGGNIIVLDHRRNSRRMYAQTLRPKFRCNVSHLQSLSDECGLLAGYCLPQTIPRIFLWDVRFPSKPVLEYETDCRVQRLLLSIRGLRFSPILNCHVVTL